MKRFLMPLAAAAALAAAVPAIADAAPWQSINQRQANLDHRIDQGVRNHSLTRPEATQLRSDFRQLARLEAQYRRSRPGLTAAERRDLDRRFDNLSQRIYAERHDWQRRR
jgi:Spy/CpxP family protein refolding chaperone